MSTKRNKKNSIKTRKMRGGMNSLRRLVSKSPKESNMEIMNPLTQNGSSEVKTGKIADNITDQIKVGSIVKYADVNQIKQIGIIRAAYPKIAYIEGDNNNYDYSRIQLYTKSELLRVAIKIIDMALSKEDSKLVSKIKQLFKSD